MSVCICSNSLAADYRTLPLRVVSTLTPSFSSPASPRTSSFHPYSPISYATRIYTRSLCASLPRSSSTTRLGGHTARCHVTALEMYRKRRCTDTQHNDSPLLTRAVSPTCPVCAFLSASARALVLSRPPEIVHSILGALCESRYIALRRQTLGPLFRFPRKSSCEHSKDNRAKMC